jgi:NAD(P)-binding Rossmann-like domain
VYAHDRNLKPDKTGETYCVTYQLEGKSLIGRDPAKVRAEMEKKRDALIADDSMENKWFDWKPVAGQGAQPEEDALVDYFGHFTPEKLDDGLPWKILDRQGEKNTFYVASFTCFESVLHCYLYAERLMDPEGRVMKEGIFPADKSKKFAVIGAGPSGLLFASQHLMKKGYTNFKIFEQSSRFGGKTLTQRRTAPGDGTVVPCELGTCYLSPAYEAMWWMFKAYGAGEVVALDRGSKSFNAIIDNDVAKTEEEREDGVEYGSWTVRKNGPVFKARAVDAPGRGCAAHWARLCCACGG